MAKGIEKEQVDIQEKPKTGQEEAINRVLEQLEKKVEPPPIEETLGKVSAALKQAQQAKTPVKMTWYCTDCGGPHIQNAAKSDYADQLPDHIQVDVVNGDFVDSSGAPLTGAALGLMEDYATPRVSSGRQSAKNTATLSKMRELKGKSK